jgi:hypothetical protein
MNRPPALVRRRLSQLKPSAFWALPLAGALAFPLAFGGIACNGAVIGTPGGNGSQTPAGGNGGGGTGKPDPAKPGDPGGSDPGNPSSSPGMGSTIGASTPGRKMCTTTPVIPEARLWRLTSSQFKNTVADAFGFTVPALDSLPSESRLDGFANASERLGISSSLFEYYGRAADDIATAAVMKASSLLKCPVASLGTGTCLADFLGTVAEKAWRRPLTPDEVTKLTTVYTTAAGDLGPEGGFKTLVQALVLSANFIFRTELGSGEAGATAGTIKLTDVELASSLSYMLWDGPPDAALMDLAKQGKLHDPDTLAGEAMRLYKSSQAPVAMASFVRQWLETEDFTDKPKDMMTFPTFSAEVAKDLEEETNLFIKGVFFDPAGDKSLTTLMTASYGYLNARTANLYGKTVTGDALTKTDLDPAQRRGLLTQASFLGAHAEPINTSVVNRGRFIREEILCSDVPPPPAAFKFDEKNITEDMTAREKFVEHSKNPACKGCHVMFDTIGFAVENYDAVGKWRTTEKGKTIDPSGNIPLPSGGELAFTNFVDFIDKLGKGTDTYDCFSSQFLQYVTGRVKLDDCERPNLARAFADSGYKFDALVTAIVKSPSFTTRTN